MPLEVDVKEAVELLKEVRDLLKVSAIQHKRVGDQTGLILTQMLRNSHAEPKLDAEIDREVIKEDLAEDFEVAENQVAKVAKVANEKDKKKGTSKKETKAEVTSPAQLEELEEEATLEGLFEEEPEQPQLTGKELNALCTEILNKAKNKGAVRSAFVDVLKKTYNVESTSKLPEKEYGRFLKLFTEAALGK